MKQLIFTTLLFISITLHSQNSNIDWKSDLAFFKVEFPKNHYDFDKLNNHNNFFNEINRISKQVDNLSDFELAVKLQQIVAKLGDSHSRVNLAKYIDRSKILPLKLFWLKDGIFILRTTEANKKIVGQKIVQINGIPIETVIDSLSTILTKDNDAIIKSSIPKLIPLVQLLQYFNIADNSNIELQLENPKGDTHSFTIQPAYMDKRNSVMFEPDSLALCYKNERAFFIDYYQPTDKIYYIQYNRCWSKELELKYGKGKNLDKLPSFNDFEEKVFQTLKKKEINKIVFDLRFNGGGNSTQGTSFIENLAKFTEKKPEKKIFVVLGRFTFSSAILNAMDFKRLTNATFVGEETSGKPNHFGEVRSFTLPSSKLKINYSTKYFHRENDNLNTLKPDHIVETSFIDFKNGIDPVYVWITKQ